MKLFQSIAVMALATCSFAWAQIGTPIIIPNPQPPYSQLVSYLSLTGDQLQSLEQIQQQRIHAQQDIYKQIGDAQNQLNTVMKSASPDPLQVGQLTLQIRSLQQQVQQAGKPFRQPALAVLTAPQQAKLQNLIAALQLQTAANQAIGLNLMDPVNLMQIMPFRDGSVSAQAQPY